MKKSNIGIGLLALALVGAVSEASACGGEWYPYMEIEEIDHRPMVMKRAEEALEAGKFDAAAGYVIRAIPHIKRIKVGKATITDRATRVLAVAIAREDGALPVKYQVPQRLHGTWLGTTSEDRAENLEWAVTTLRALGEEKKDDPALQTELAEALAKAGEQVEARKTLEGLAKKDLIASPEGWAVLADLRDQAGDQAGSQVAMGRCKAMARDPQYCMVDSAAT
jgi:hypothetical protein